jgi:hypothetical protein
VDGVCATDQILGREIQQRDWFAGQLCCVIHWPNVQVE